MDLVFGPDGNLYVANQHGGVQEFNGTTGALIQTFADAPGAAGMLPASVAFGPDGDLYVGTGGACCPENAGEIVKYNPITGTLLGVFVPQGSGGLADANYLTFRSDGYLYVNSFNTAGDNASKAILRYNATNGAFGDDFIAAGDGGLTAAANFTFTPSASPVPEIRDSAGDVSSPRRYCGRQKAPPFDLLLSAQRRLSVETTVDVLLVTKARGLCPTTPPGPVEGRPAFHVNAVIRYPG